MAETIAESAKLWYNINMKNQFTTDVYYTPIQMKIPVDLEKIIEISDQIYTFNELMNKIDLRKYFVGKGNRMGRPRFDSIKMNYTFCFYGQRICFVKKHRKAM